MRVLVSIFFICFLQALAWAQPYTACFTEEAVKGCVPFTVRVHDCSGVSSNPNIGLPQYDFGATSSNAWTVDSFFTYTQPGVYTVKQKIDDGTGFINTQTKTNLITVVASPAPNININTCIGNQITLQVSDNVYDYYEILFGDGSPMISVAGNSTTPHTYASSGTYSVQVKGGFTVGGICGSITLPATAYSALVNPDITDLRVISQSTTTGQLRFRYSIRNALTYDVQESVNGGAYSTILNFKSTITDTSSALIASRNTQANTYCYRLIEKDDCGNQAISENICSVILNGTAINQDNQLNWNNYTTYGSNFSTYTLIRDNTTLSSSLTTTTYDDINVVCGNNYCYSTVATLTTSNNAGSTHKSYSAPFCLTAVSTSTPPAVTNVNSTFNNNQILVSWTSAGTITANIMKSVSGGTSTSVGTSTTSTFNDPNWTSTDSYCYTIQYADNCGNNSPLSLTTCPVVLQTQQTSTDIQLSWNTYTGFDNSGVASYVVEKLNTGGTVISSSNVGLALSFTEPIDPTGPDVYYRIKANPVNGTYSPSSSNTVLISFDGKIVAPTIFTPNGDNVNDIFIVKGKFIQDFQLYIFNRWGQTIYYTNLWNSGWDGTTNFTDAPNGVYTWKVIAKDNKGKEIIETGTITLER
ncbi:MAG: gliding motility-associated C-terminal domain-containing protein [Cytophagaceae bacterium]